LAGKAFTPLLSAVYTLRELTVRSYDEYTVLETDIGATKLLYRDIRLALAGAVLPTKAIDPVPYIRPYTPFTNVVVESTLIIPFKKIDPDLYIDAYSVALRVWPAGMVRD
jgi:hypothetical protein